MVRRRTFPELEARAWFAAARISVVVTGGTRAERSDAVTCGFPHRPRRFYRQPSADAALKACSAMKTSSCSERNESSSSRSTRMAAAGAARPGIGRHRPVIQVFRFVAAPSMRDQSVQESRSSGSPEVHDRRDTWIAAIVKSTVVGNPFVHFGSAKSCNACPMALPSAACVRRIQVVASRAPASPVFKNSRSLGLSQSRW
jgi:hypothetical protein